MSLMLIAGAGNACLDHYFGLARDPASWGGSYLERESADAWFMTGDGALWGNGKEGDDSTSDVNEGDIVSMEANLDKGTLRFWANGKPHGPGFTSGVAGRLRWAVSLGYPSGAVQIVPTPELQRWSES